MQMHRGHAWVDPLASVLLVVAMVVGGLLWFAWMLLRWPIVVGCFFMACLHGVGYFFYALGGFSYPDVHVGRDFLLWSGGAGLAFTIKDPLIVIAYLLPLPKSFRERKD